MTTLHAMTMAARNPRKAPTTINTVPFGRVDTCMYWAICVSGTTAVGMGKAPFGSGGALVPSPASADVVGDEIGGIDTAAEDDDDRFGRGAAGLDVLESLVDGGAGVGVTDGTGFVVAANVVEVKLAATKNAERSTPALEFATLIVADLWVNGVEEW
jgi:hypothetical protein